MLAIRLIWRVLILQLLICAPLAGVGFLLFGRLGALVLISLSVIFSISVFFTSEKALIRYYGAQKTQIPGFKTTLHRIEVETQTLNQPDILVFSDPSPEAVLARRPFGRGTVILSQGFIGAINERELQETLKLCFAKVRRKRIVFQSFCSVLLLGVLYIVPKSWLHLSLRETVAGRGQPVSAISALGFLILLPLIRTLENFGKLPVPGMEEVSEPIVASAMRKIYQTRHVWKPLHSIRTSLSIYP